MPNPPTAAEWAKDFYNTHRAPDAQWFIDEVLIPQLSQRFDAYARQRVEVFREQAMRLATETIPYQMPVPCPEEKIGCLVLHTVKHYRRRTGDEIATAFRALP